MEIDVGNVNPDEVQSGGRAAAGKCHLRLQSFEEFGASETGSHVADWEVLAHEDPSQVACRFRDFLTDPGNAKSDNGKELAVKRLLIYAYVLGVTTPEAVKQAKASGQFPKLDFDNAIGRQACATLINDEYVSRGGTKKTSVKVGNYGLDLFEVDSPKAAGHPKNQGYLAKARRGEGANLANRENGDNDSQQDGATQDDPFAAVL